MELCKIVFFLIIGSLLSANLADACAKKQAEIQTRFRPTEMFEERITNAVRPILHSLFNLGDIDGEKFSFHIDESIGGLAHVIIYLSNLSIQELTAINKNVIDKSVNGRVFNMEANAAIRKLLDLIVINGRDLSKWYFNTVIYPTTMIPRSVVLSIKARPPQNKLPSGLEGVIAVYHDHVAEINFPEHNSVKV